MTDKIDMDLLAKAMGSKVGEDGRIEVAMVDDDDMPDFVPATESAAEPVAEVKQEDTPAEKQDIDKESSLTDNPLQKESPKSESVQAAAKTIDELLSEKSNGRFKSYGELENHLATPKDEFANEFVKRLNGYVKDGGKAEDFLRTQTTDYTKADDLSVLREQHRADNSDLTEEEISLLIEDTYKTNEEAYTEREVSLGKIRMKADAKKARQSLISNQVKSAVAPQEKVRADEATSKAEWVAKVDDSMKTFKNIDIGFDKGKEKFTYEVDENDKKAIREITIEPTKFFGQYISKEGQFDIAKMNNDLMKLRKFDDIVEKFANHLKGKGVEETIKEIKNVDFTPAGTKAAKPTTESYESQIMKQLA